MTRAGRRPHPSDGGGRASYRRPPHEAGLGARLGGVAVLGFAACGPVTPGDYPPPNPELLTANQDAGDPYFGRFPYEEAVAGLPAGTPMAVLVTDEGEIHCRLAIDTAPLTVANFIGLARGLRPFQLEADGPWLREPYYVDLPWHRAIERQFIQTGERGGPSSPGYRLQDERSIGDAFDGPGVLAMANRGMADTAGAEFFVTSAALRDLDGQYTIFGRCSDPFVVRALEERAVEGGDATPRLVEVRIEVES